MPRGHRLLCFFCSGAHQQPRQRDQKVRQLHVQRLLKTKHLAMTTEMYSGSINSGNCNAKDKLLMTTLNNMGDFVPETPDRQVFSFLKSDHIQSTAIALLTS
eukprot:5266502-Amphidinium_carterae.1